MLRQLHKLKKRTQGFTIIEVLIVLAIAALIMVIVLIAIPQLQRNQRNTARRATGSRIAAEIGNYIGNNNGVPPSRAITSAQGNFGTPRTTLGFFNRYLGCTGNQAAPALVTCTTDINDPSSGQPMGTGARGQTDEVVLGCPGNVPPVNSVAGGAPVPGNFCYETTRLCNGEVAAAAINGVPASPRNYVFMVRLEGGAIACFDNG